MGEHRMVVEQAWRMFLAGERDRAYEVADEVLALDPFDYRASELRLAQLLDHGAYAEARRLCLQLQAANPVSGWLWERRCQIAGGLEKGDELVEAGRAWLRSEPEQPRAHLEIARGYALCGEDGAARRALVEAIEQMPGEADLHVALGDWCVDHDDHASARRAYRTVIELEPGLDVPNAPRVFDGYLDLTVRTLLACMVAALAIAVPARLALGGFWGGLVALGLVGAAFWAHREWFGRMRAEVPHDHLTWFAERHRVLIAADIGALVGGVIAVVLAFVTDLAAQQVGVVLVLAALAIGAGVGLLRRNPRDQ